MLNAILITTGSRPDLLRQSIRSIIDNAADPKNIHLTLAIDGIGIGAFEAATDHYGDCDANIWLPAGVGASAARNIGASSVPKYRRGSHVAFFDDDVYAVKGWDAALMDLSRQCQNELISGHSHPYNNCAPVETIRGLGTTGCKGEFFKFGRPLVISTVNFFMPWAMWDHVGFFDEPGGAGASEDFNWCQRASKLSYGFAVTEPQAVLHCGLTSSTGKQIVGHAEMVAQNERLIKLHGLKGVIWQ